MRFSRTVVVTGASRGLGLEWVRQLSNDSKTFVIATVRDVEKAKQDNSSGIVLSKENVAVVNCDLSDLDSFTTVVDKIKELCHGKVDILINNAAIMVSTKSGKISESTPQEWTDQFNVNVVALVFFTIALLPLLEAGTDKKVVNITSMLADIGYTLDNPEVQLASYSAIKAAVTMANAKFHIEFREKGFVFLALNPGWANTDLGGQNAPLQPHESISQCLRFVLRSGPADSGKFFSLDGRPEAVTD